MFSPIMLICATISNQCLKRGEWCQHHGSVRHFSFCPFWFTINWISITKEEKRGPLHSIWGSLKDPPSLCPEVNGLDYGEGSRERKVSGEPGPAEAVLTKKAVISQAMSQHCLSGRGCRIWRWWEGHCPGTCAAAGRTSLSMKRLQSFRGRKEK